MRVPHYLQLGNQSESDVVNRNQVKVEDAEGFSRGQNGRTACYWSSLLVIYKCKDSFHIPNKPQIINEIQEVTTSNNMDDLHGLSIPYNYKWMLCYSKYYDLIQIYFRIYQMICVLSKFSFIHIDRLITSYLFRYQSDYKFKD